MKEIFKEYILGTEEFISSNRIIPRLAKRKEELAQITELLTSPKIKKGVVFVGPRRSGKTFFMLELGKIFKDTHPEKIPAYINFEDERLIDKEISADSIVESFLEVFPGKGVNEALFLLDEVHTSPNWEIFSKRLIEYYGARVVLTGSNSKLLSSEIATSMRGRTFSLQVFPLDLKEFLRFKGFELTEKTKYLKKTKVAFKKLMEELLFYGSFPEVVLIESRTLKEETLKDYLEAIFYRDIIERFEPAARKLKATRYFRRRVFESTGSPLSVHRIFNEMKSLGYKIGKDKLYDLLEVFKDAYMVIEVPHFESSSLKEKQKQKKYYPVDTGLLNVMLPPGSLKEAKLFETLIATLLVRSGHKIFYWKEYWQSGECDFVALKEPHGIYAIQATYSLTEENLLREIKALKQCMAKTGIKNGYILTFEEVSPEVKKLLGAQPDQAIEAKPFYEFFLETGSS